MRFYLCYPKRFIATRRTVTRLNVGGEELENVVEEQTLTINPFGASFTPPFSWTAAYDSTDNPSVCVVACDEELPAGVYERELVTDTDFEEVYAQWASLRQPVEGLRQ